MMMLSRLRTALQTPVYKNTGSTARDHLASERTFLAWIRTGLGLVALGVAMERFSQLDPSALQDAAAAAAAAAVGSSGDDRDQAVLAGSLVGLGSGTIVYGAARYFSNLRELEAWRFRPAYRGPAVLAAAAASLAGGLYGSTLRRTRREAAGERAAHRGP